nr:hypothetical protein [Candidatus Njordarchaeum guaymaensis]
GLSMCSRPQGGGNMVDAHICPRCGGVVQHVKLSDETGVRDIDGYECLNCTLLFSDYCETAESVRTLRRIQAYLSSDTRVR